MTNNSKILSQKMSIANQPIVAGNQYYDPSNAVFNTNYSVPVSNTGVPVAYLPPTSATGYYSGVNQNAPMTNYYSQSQYHSVGAGTPNYGIPVPVTSGYQYLQPAQTFQPRETTRTISKTQDHRIADQPSIPAGYIFPGHTQTAGSYPSSIPTSTSVSSSTGGYPVATAVPANYASYSVPVSVAANYAAYSVNTQNTPAAPTMPAEQYQPEPIDIKQVIKETLKFRPVAYEKLKAEQDDLIPLHIYGEQLLPNGTIEPIVVKTHITTHIYLRLPRIVGGTSVSWDYKYLEVIAAMKKALSTRGLEHLAPLAHECSLEYKYPLYYYTTKKYPYIKIRVPNDMAVRELKRNFPRGVFVRGFFSPKETTCVNAMFEETNVDPVRRMLTTKNLKPSQWMECPGSLVENRETSLKNEYEIDWSQLKPVDDSVNTNPMLVSFDIETYSDNKNAMPVAYLTTHVAYIITATFQQVNKSDTRKRFAFVYTPETPNMKEWLDLKLQTKTDCTIVRSSNEIDMIEQFARVVRELDPTIVTGYNIISYDFAYLDSRLKRYGQKWPQMGRMLDEPAELSSKKWASSGYGYNELNILKMTGRISVDLLPVIKREHNRLPKYDLNTVSIHFLGRGKHDVSAKEMFTIYERILNTYELCKDISDFSDIEKVYSDEQLIEILDLIANFDRLKREAYCKQLNESLRKQLLEFAVRDFLRVLEYAIEDAELVIDLFHKLNVWVSSIETSNVEGISIMDLSTRGQQIRGFSQISILSHNNNYVMEKVELPKQPYKGAIVQHPIPGLYRNVICLDFASLYPTIIMAYNLCWSTFIPEDRWNDFKDQLKPEDYHEFIWSEEIEEDEFGEDEDGDTEVNDNDDTKEKKMITVNHCYRFVKEHIREGLLPQLVRNLVNERKYIRDVLMKAEKDPVAKNILDARQLATKVSANSKYGMLGAQLGGMLPLVPAAAVVTYVGRQSITKVNNYLKDKYGAKIVYGDTDSTMIDMGIKNAEECNKWGKILEKEVSELFPAPMKMEFEKAMKVMFCIAPKKYAAILIDKEGNPIIYSDQLFADNTYAYPDPVDRVAEYNELPPELTAEQQFTKSEHYFTKNRLKFEEANDRLRNKEPVYDVRGQLIAAPHLKDGKDVIKDIYKYVVLFNDQGRPVTFQAKQDLYTNINYTIDGSHAADISKFLTKGIILARRDNCKRQRKVYSKLLIHILLKGLQVDEAWATNITAYTNQLKSIHANYIEQIKTYDPEYLPKLARKLKVKPEVAPLYVSCVDRPNIKQVREVVTGFIHYLTTGINMIYKAGTELMSRSVPWTELTFIRSVSGDYKSDNYFMKVFADQLALWGKPVNAGDRLDYLIVKNTDPDKDLLGLKMRTPDIYMDRVGTEEQEAIDTNYYLEKVYMNCLEQLIQVGFQHELDLMYAYYQYIGRGHEKRPGKYTPAYTRITTKPIKKMIKFLSVRDTMLAEIRQRGDTPVVGPVVNEPVVTQVDIKTSEVAPTIPINQAVAPGASTLHLTKATVSVVDGGVTVYQL